MDNSRGGGADEMSASELQRATEGEGDESAMCDSEGEARQGLQGKQGSRREARIAKYSEDHEV